MSGLELERGLEVSVRLRSADKLLPAEIAANDAGPHTELLLLESPGLLRRSEFDRGVDIERIRDGDRFAVEDVQVDALDLEKGILRVSRLAQLPRVARRANFREPATIPVILTIEGDQFRGETLELSGGGFSFVIDRSHEASVGTPVGFRLELDPPVVGTGALTWTSCRSGQQASGVRFTHLEGRSADQVYATLYRLQAIRRRRSVQSSL